MSNSKSDAHLMISHRDDLLTWYSVKGLKSLFCIGA